MHYLLYAVLFSAFAWMVLTVNGRRRFASPDVWPASC